MNSNKSILMPHKCQKIGWWLLLLSVLVEGTKTILLHTTANIDTAWYLAKSSHLLLILSLFLICLSKEKVEDEMIASLRLKAVGITAYVFFVLFLITSITLELHLYRFFWDGEGYLPEFISELFLIVLPILVFGLYYIIFKGMLLRSKKEQVL
ncbi:MAG: hypothetical protein IKN06_04620 [Bacteroidales bacterium]|nr:hypothetical protein [Bacteroidales bacterium]